MQNNNSTFNNSNNRRLTAHFIKILIFFSFSLLFNACGGGDSDDTDDTPSDVKTGVFVDSPVAGLRYQSQDIGGTTNAKGEFKYREGQKVQFFIGDLGIGEAEGAAQITPLDLFADAANVTDQRVKNLAALLQTLDENQDASDGIVLNAEVQAAIQATTAEEIIQIDFDQQTNDLTNIAEVKRLLMAANSSTTQARPLKNTDAALVHLQGSIGNTQSELFSISINVTGLNTGDGELRFSNFAQDQLVFGESGLLSFSTQLPATAHYSISIDEPMPAQKSCSLIEGESFSGVISNDVTIQVLCQAKKTAVTIDFSDDTLSLLPANFSMQFKDNQSNSFLDLNPSDDGQVVQLIEPAFLNNLQLFALKDGSGETIIGKICNSSYASETLTIVCNNKKYSVGGTISGVGGNFTLAYRRNSSVGDPIVINFSLDDVDDNGLFVINNVFEHGDEFVIESFATEASNKQCSFEFDEDEQADELPYSGTINDADALELSITCVSVHAVSVNIRGLSVSRPYAQELIIGVSDDAQNQYENINVAFNTSDGTPLNLKQAASNDNQLIIEGTNLIFSLNQPTGRRCSFVANGEISVLPETLVSEQNVNNFTGQVQYVLCARDSASMSGKINTLPGGLTTFPSVQYKDALLPDIESNWITASVDNNGNYTISGVIETGVDLKVSEFSNFRCDFDRGNPYASNSDNKIGTTINPTVSVAEINCLAATPLVLELEILGGKANISGADQFAIDIFQYSENSWKKIGDFIVADKQNTDLISVVLPRVYRNGSRINYSVSINSFPLVFQSCDPFDSIRVDRSTTFALTCDLNGGD